MAGTRPRRLAGALAFVFLAACPALARGQELICDPGDVEVRELTFQGNRALSDEELAYAVATTPSHWARSLFRIGDRRCLDREELPRDSLRLTILYRRRGYGRVSVRYDVLPRPRNAVEVRFVIDEGPPVILTELAVTGLDPLRNAAQITRNLPLRVQRPFDRYALEASRDTIERRLRNSGYPRALVLSQSSVDSSTFTASAQIEVVPGELTRIGEIRIDVDALRGRRQQISDGLVRRMLGFEEGDIYRDRDLTAAQRTLYQTEAYRHVDVRLAPDSAQRRPDSAVVLVNVLEGQMRSARVGVGWASLDCFRTQGQFTHLNFLQRAQRLELTGRLSKIGIGYPLRGADWACPAARPDPFSDTLNYYVGATFRQPRLFGLRYIPTLTVYSELRSEYQAYLRSIPIGGVATATREAGRRTPLTLSYQMEYGRTAAQPALFCAVFNICTSEDREEVQQRQRLAVGSAAIARDRTDNPLNPSRGWTARLEARHSSRLIGSDPGLSFNRLTGDAAWYQAVGEGRVLAARLRVGGVLGGKISLEGAGPETFIPPQERLYAGGAGTVRGFRQNELGPIVYIVDTFTVVNAHGTTFLRADTLSRRARTGDSLPVGGSRVRPVSRPVPTGGNSLIVGNVELRMRSRLFPDLLQWTVFGDFGEVWNRGKEGLNFNQLKWTPGVGLRVFTVVGAIRVDVGYNPYARPAGAAYYQAPVRDGIAPLYCVSPGNTLPVELPVDVPAGSPADVPEQAAGDCPATFQPPRETNFFRRLNFNFSIGQAF